MAKPPQSRAQATASALLAVLAPENARDRFSSMHSVAVEDEISEEPLDRVDELMVGRTAVVGYLHSPEEANPEAVDHSRSDLWLSGHFREIGGVQYGLWLGRGKAPRRHPAQDFTYGLHLLCRNCASTCPITDAVRAN